MVENNVNLFKPSVTSLGVSVHPGSGVVERSPEHLSGEFLFVGFVPVRSRPEFLSKAHELGSVGDSYHHLYHLQPHSSTVVKT